MDENEEKKKKRINQRERKKYKCSEGKLNGQKKEVYY